jgi:hypothetical protein
MFSYKVHTAIDIDASAAAIWRVLTEFSQFDQWNPMLRNVHTDFEPGATVRFEVRRQGSKPLKLKAKIVKLSESEALAWRGGPKGVLTGEHVFRIEPLGEGRCRFYHGERFNGLLLPLLKGALKDAPALYRSMNEALKNRVERQFGSAGQATPDPTEES